MTNIVDALQGYLTDDLISKAADTLGENSNGIATAASALIPTILGGLASKTSDTSGFGSIFNMLQDKQNEGWLDNLGSLIGGGNLAQGDPKDIAGRMMGSLFGNKMGGILDLISSRSSIKRGSASSILGMVGPLIMSYLGRKIRTEGLSALDLGKFLGKQTPHIAKAMPMGMGDIIGFAADAGRESVSRTTTTTSSSTGSTGGGNKWLWPLLIAAAAALGFYFMRGCEAPEAPKVDVTEQVDKMKDAAGNAVDKADEMAKDAGNAVADAADKAGDMAKDAGNTMKDAAGNVLSFFKRELACGIELSIPRNGIEAQVIDFIESDKAVDKTTWFNFDRLTFATGSSNLDMDKSGEQLDNIYEIMKCYPDAKVKIGGYTDNTGNAASNVTLSQKRADAVVAALTAKGIDATRMEAEGYGQAHPVASNDTEEGRAQNRRIALRVTAK